MKALDVDYPSSVDKQGNQKGQEATYKNNLLAHNRPKGQGLVYMKYLNDSDCMGTECCDCDEHFNARNTQKPSSLTRIFVAVVLMVVAVSSLSVAFGADVEEAPIVKMILVDLAVEASEAEKENKRVADEAEKAEKQNLVKLAKNEGVK